MDPIISNVRESSSSYRMNLQEKQLRLSRRLVPATATRKYEAGNIITACVPLAKVLERKQQGKLCNYCLKKTKLGRCQACGMFYYCSKKCQVADWNAAHKFKECALYRKDVMGKLYSSSTLYRLVIRVYLMMKNSDENRNDASKDKSLFTKDFICFNGHRRNFMELMSFYDKIRLCLVVNELFGFKIAYTKILGDSCDWYWEDLVVITGIIKSNSFCIKDYDESLGLGIYIEASIFNPSLEANAIIEFVGDEMRVVAEKQINPGSEILINSLQNMNIFYWFTRMVHHMNCKCIMCKHKMRNLHVAKMDFFYLRLQFDCYYQRGFCLLGMLVYKRMKAISLLWPLEPIMDTTREDFKSQHLLNQLGDSVRENDFNVPNLGPFQMILNSDEFYLFCLRRRHFSMASRDIKVGERIRDGIPNYYVILPQFKKQYCNMCLRKIKESGNNYSCPKCEKFFYCSAGCRQADETVHLQFECWCNNFDCRNKSNCLQKPENAIMNLYFRLYSGINRESFRFIDEEDYDLGIEVTPLDMRAINKRPHGKRKNTTTYKVFCNDTNMLPSKLGNPVDNFLETCDKFLDAVIGFAQPNLFYICDEKTKERIALGSFTSFRITKHSLEPNSEYLLENGILSMRAKKPILEGETIYVGYY